jgi:hypothetical protein
VRRASASKTSHASRRDDAFRQFRPAQSAAKELAELVLHRRDFCKYIRQLQLTVAALRRQMHSFFGSTQLAQTQRAKTYAANVVTSEDSPFGAVI